MVRMSEVWDRTTDVLSGRGRTLAEIAGLAIFLPGVVAKGYVDYVGNATPGTAAIGGLLSLAVALIAIWGQLALISLSTDPATTRSYATATASRRLLPAIGIALLIGIVIGLLTIPFFVALAASGVTAAALRSGEMPPMSLGIGGFVAIYALILVVVFLIFSARFALWTAVIVNERLGLGTIRRTFALTRGLTLKIIGVVLLYLIVLLVAFGAVTAVTGIVFRLILGADAGVTALFVAQIVGGIVTTAFAVVAAVFCAQLYVACRGPLGVSTDLR